MISPRIFLAIAFVLGSIVNVEAKTSSNLLRRNVALLNDNVRDLQNNKKPNHPDLKIGPTTGGTITATASFYEKTKRQHIRVFQEDCATKFDPDVEFSIVGGDSSLESEWEGEPPRNDSQSQVEFIIPLQTFLDHLNGIDEGEVDICIQLESDNTYSNTRVTIKLDLTSSAGVSVEAEQPDAVDLNDVTVETTVDAWVCAGDDADPKIPDNEIETLEVPGKIYVCIQVSDGYAIRRGKLTANSEQTGAGVDKEIEDYMKLAEGETGQYNVDDTYQVFPNNIVRVSFMANRQWATLTSQKTLTIDVNAYFEPIAERRLATSRHLAKFQPGSLRIKNKEQFASTYTTVQLRAASGAGPQLTPGAGPGAGPAPTSEVIPDDTTPTNDSKTNTAAIAGAAGAGAFVVVAVVFFLVSRKRRQEEEGDAKSIVALETTDKGSLDSTTRSSIRSSISSNNGSDQVTSCSSVSNPRVSGNPNSGGLPHRQRLGSQRTRGPPRRSPQGSPRASPHRQHQGPRGGPPRRTSGGVSTGAPRNAHPRRPRGPSRAPNSPVPANGGRVAPPRHLNCNVPGPAKGPLRPKAPPSY